MQLSVWQFICLFGSVVGSYAAILKFVIDLFEKRIMDKFTHIEKAETELRGKVEKQATEMLRRDEWIRETASTQRTLDRVQTSLDVMLKSLGNKTT
jgi:hypothetical protein